MILELEPKMKEDTSVLTQIYLRAQSGDLVPLSAFAKFERGTSPVVVAHEGQFPSVTISFDVANGSSLGDAIEAVHRTEDRIGLPASVHAGFQGTAAAFSTSLASEPFLILAALVTVYIVLGVLYESFIHPVTILSTLPSAGVGAALALMITGSEFDVIALIGIVLLIGIVKKNAIMMIDFAIEAERDERKTPAEAIHQACLLRFRPIMMTTMAALLGAVPLAFGTGTGSELRRPMGIAIVGGLMLSQILTLYTTPVIYLYMEALKRKLTSSTVAEPQPSETTRVNVSAPFVRRPVATMLLAAALFLAGALAWTKLPVSPLPKVDFPTLQVTAAMPGASPETMASAVATPLERRFGRISGVTEITSSSSLGSTQNHAPVRLDRDVDAAARDVQAAIAAASGELPPDLPLRPTFRKVNPSDSPIMIVSLTSKTIPLSSVFEQANTILAQKIAQVPGVGQVNVGGGQQPAVRVRRSIRLRSRARASRTKTFAQRSRIRRRLLPKGALASGKLDRTVDANDQLSTAAAFGEVVVEQSAEGTVRLKDIASVTDTSRTTASRRGRTESARCSSSSAGSPARTSSRRTNASAISCRRSRSSISPDIVITSAIDRTQTIRASVSKTSSARCSSR